MRGKKFFGGGAWPQTLVSLRFNKKNFWKNCPLSNSYNMVRNTSLALTTPLNACHSFSCRCWTSMTSRCWFYDLSWMAYEVQTTVFFQYQHTFLLYSLSLKKTSVCAVPSDASRASAPVCIHRHPTPEGSCFRGTPPTSITWSISQSSTSKRTTTIIFHFVLSWANPATQQNACLPAPIGRLSSLISWLWLLRRLRCIRCCCTLYTLAIFLRSCKCCWWSPPFPFLSFHF